MPAARSTLSLADAHDLVASAGFAPGVDAGSGDQVGLELEWLLYRPDDTDAVVPAPVVRAAAGGDHSGPSRITYEPGGQVEVSSPPATTVGAAIARAATDARRLRDRLAAAGVRTVALGLDPARPRRRVLDTPRYRAMADYFARAGSAGATMMCATAALQVNVGLGTGRQPARRWRLAHDLGPVLSATFAHSPLSGHRPSGWHSTRMAVWHALDPTRTAPAHPAGGGHDAGGDWAAYALAARVMLVRLGPDRYVVPAEPLTFAQWLTRGHAVGHPTPEDLHYHLTTLFPPVRARGWLELRMLDALPDPTWRVAAAITAVLVLDDDAPAALEAVLAPTRGRWLDAARLGLHDPALQRAADACFEHALARLADHDVDADTIAAASDHRAELVAHGRTPADERLAAWRARRELVPGVAADRTEALQWV